MKYTELQTEKQQKTIENLNRLLDHFKQSNDRDRAKKLEETVTKYLSHQLNIGFCGHFSAGKSTMINTLLGKFLLPASPIPTSANLVMICSGEPRAEIFFSNGDKTVIEVENIDQWKEYCKNGQEVERVVIYDQHPLLEEGIQLLDTPGVDSTDSAHQSATEEALHLADFIIFVTDYNHVQSENNFNFIKQLKEKGKKLILVVNQIDKHREEELTIQQFDQKIKEGLKEWGISLDGLIYTSMKVPTHPYNQLELLKTILGQVKEQKEEILQEHVIHAAESLLYEHAQFQKQLSAGEREEIENQIKLLKEEVDWEAHSTLLDEYIGAMAAPKTWGDELKSETEKILTSAIITPYTTTQLAQELIESYQKDFKVGWLFSSKKTEEERARRLEALYEDLSDKVTSQIEWHIKELLKKKNEQYHLVDKDFQSMVMDWTIQFPKDILIQEIKEGTVSREFVYHYTTAISKRIHQLYRSKVTEFISMGIERMRKQNEVKFQPQEKLLTKLKQIQQLENEILLMDQQIENERKALHGMLIQGIGYHEDQLTFVTQALEGKESSILTSGVVEKKEAKVAKNKQNNIQLNKAVLFQVADQLEKAASIMEQIPSFASLVKDFREKATRLKENQFTVCLFGAFSAGKSSFANALMGEQVLPVSPNPTTAAINQVLPASPKHPSGTAMIKMKSRDQVEEEIKIALNRLQLADKKEVFESLKQIEKIKPHELRPSLKAYYSFLSACFKGWTEAQELLDTQFEVKEEEFNQFVAVEKKACFVESIQLFHESYLTQNGVVLIDTPGADSIYSRHTNVTFNYIKNADVILYVTYYNHAFSRADRDFLDQLGRVKDQFSLDKMFFLVNAADLAESKEELDGVVEHVSQNLLQSGIRFPRIYPVSSLQAIQGNPESGMEAFEQAFFSFLQDDLAQLMIESAQRDLEKAYVLIEEMKVEQLSSTELRAVKIKDLEQKESHWIEQIQQEEYPGVKKELSKEIQELLYYVKQRIFFNFQRHLNDSFHPSVLSGDKISKKELILCLEELLFSVLYHLKDELKATSLRLEKMTYKILERTLVEWKRNIQNERIMISGDSIKRDSFELPPVPDEFTVVPRKELEGTLSHFKNPKYFFEQGGKDKLRHDLEKLLDQVVEAYLNEVQGLYEEFYHQAWEDVERRMKQGLMEEIRVAVATRKSALKGELSIEQLEQIMLQYQQKILQ